MGGKVGEEEEKGVGGVMKVRGVCVVRRGDGRKESWKESWNRGGNESGNKSGNGKIFLRCAG